MLALPFLVNHCPYGHIHVELLSCFLRVVCIRTRSSGNLLPHRVSKCDLTVSWGDPASSMFLQIPRKQGEALRTLPALPTCRHHCRCLRHSLAFPNTQSGTLTYSSQLCFCFPAGFPELLNNFSVCKRTRGALSGSLSRPRRAPPLNQALADSHTAQLSNCFPSPFLGFPGRPSCADKLSP